MTIVSRSAFILDNDGSGLGSSAKAIFHSQLASSDTKSRHNRPGTTASPTHHDVITIRDSCLVKLDDQGIHKAISIERTGRTLIRDCPYRAGYRERRSAWMLE